VLPAEAATEEGASVLVAEPVPPGKNVGRIGEDVTAGRTVLIAGRRLRPQDLGLLASIGVGNVSVMRRPTVAILVTGDELLPPGSRPEGFRIVDSNSVVLAALVQRDGGLPRPTVYLPDRPEVIRATLAASDADVILVSGGSSVGKEDHAPRLVAELGELPIHGLALRPASPTGIGFVAGRPVFLLPGNPVSCLCAYDLFAGRAVRRLGGRAPGPPYRTEDLPLAAKIVSAVGRVDYVRVRVTEAGAEPVAVSGASLLSTTVVADGFVLVERDREGHAPGERVTVYRYDEPVQP
jgi:molybdopterin molybdotransferase